MFLYCCSKYDDGQMAVMKLAFLFCRITAIFDAKRRLRSSLCASSSSRGMRVEPGKAATQAQRTYIMYHTVLLLLEALIGRRVRQCKFLACKHEVKADDRNIAFAYNAYPWGTACNGPQLSCYA